MKELSIKKSNRITKKSTHKLQLLSLAILLIVIITCTLVSFNVSGSTKAKDKLYTTVLVEDGDSLWTIAKNYYSDEYIDYNEYIEEVKSINGMKNSNIKTENYIIVPYYHD